MSNMKMVYQTPKMEMIEFDLQSLLLVNSSSSLDTLRLYDDEDTEEQI